MLAWINDVMDRNYIFKPVTKCSTIKLPAFSKVLLAQLVTIRNGRSDAVRLFDG